MRVSRISITFFLLLATNARWIASAEGAVTYTWNVSGTGTWTVAGNWSPARTTPASDDILVFDGGVTPTATATGVSAQTIGQLRVTGSALITLTGTGSPTLSVTGGAGEDLLIGLGAKLALSGSSAVTISLSSGVTGSISGEMTVEGGAHRILPTDAGSLAFVSGSNFRTLTGFSGSPFGNTGTTNVVVFGSGATYHHGAGLHPFGLTAPQSRVTLESGSLFRLLAPPGTGAFGGRTYGHLEFNTNPEVTVVGGSPLVMTAQNVTIFAGGFRNTTTNANYEFLGDLTVMAPGYFEQTPSSGTATISFNGTGMQTIAGNGSVKLGTMSNLAVPNPTGVTLGRDLFSDGTLTLSGGRLTTGPYLMTLGQIGSVVGPKWVTGNLGRIFPGSAGTVTRTFEVGDATRAAGVTVSFASVQDSGVLVVRTELGDHSDLSASGLDPAASVNRSWVVQNLGVAFTTCDISLLFDPADLDAGTDPNDFRVGKRDGVTWSLPAVGTRTATSTQAIALTSFSDFVVAEPIIGVTAVDPAGFLAAGLAPARPTLFRESTELEFRLERGSAVDLAIYGVDGRRVRTLERRERSAGVHRIGWDGRDDVGREVASGVYHVRLHAGRDLFHRRLIKVK